MRLPPRLAALFWLITSCLAGALASGVLPARAAAAEPAQKPGAAVTQATPVPPEGGSQDRAFETVRVSLFFLRQATQFKVILDAISGADGKTEVPVSPLKGLVVGAPSEDLVILYGTHQQVRDAQRLIASVDLPVPGVQMDMWGVQISSRDPKKLREAVGKVRTDIEQARAAVRDFDRLLQEQAARTLTPEPGFQALLTHGQGDAAPGLGYTGALATDRPLSVSDILLRLIAAPPDQIVPFANSLSQRLGYGPSASEGAPASFRATYRDILEPQSLSVPFSRLFASRGLVPINGVWAVRPGDPTLEEYNRLARKSVLDFTFQYADMVERPGQFSPYELQQTADTLNSRLQTAVDALNQDIEELVVDPAISKIGRDLDEAGGVEYAQIGRVRVASLNGVETTVSGASVSAFDSAPPLRLSDLLRAAAKAPTASVPSSELIGLLAAADQDRTVWNPLSEGVSLVVTPHVLRNATSAELTIHLTMADPQPPSEAGAAPISRVSQHDVRDTVYVNALDILDLSTFSSQATVAGGRAYVPVVGPFWHGIFGDVPVLGDLFSWKKNPQSVYHQSVLFASTIISPTAMGLALLYPIQGAGTWDAVREKMQQQVDDYPTAP